MKQIKKLDTKYLVLKTEDLDKYFSGFQSGVLVTEEEQKYIDSIPFKKVLMDVDKQRRWENKSINNKHVVLNLDDKIDFEDLEQKIITLYTLQKLEKRIFHVRDVAVDIVNAILKAKDAEEPPQPGVSCSPK